MNTVKTNAGATVKITRPDTFVPTLSAATKKALGDAVDSQNKNESKWKKAADLLMGDQVTSAMLEKPKAGATSLYQEIINEVKGIIVLKFSDHEQKLLRSDISVLSDPAKDERRKTQQKTGARYSLIQFYLRKAEQAVIDAQKKAEAEAALATMSEDEIEAALKAEKAEKAAKKKADEIQRLRKGLSAVLANLEKLQEANFDIPKAKFQLQVTLDMIK